MSEVWRSPSDFNIPGTGGRPVILLVDFGLERLDETYGRAFLLTDGTVVFSDAGGWCTQYVKGWRPMTQEEWGHYHSADNPD